MTNGQDEPEKLQSVSLKWKSRVIAIVCLLLLLMIVALLAIGIGSTRISFSTTLSIILSKLPGVSITPTWPGPIETAILNIRMPRVILAGVSGAALSVAGATYQGLFRNPLADPYLIGVSQGAALGAIIGFLIPLSASALSLGIVPIFAFTGGIGAVFVVYSLGRVGRTLPMTTIILAGVALGAFLSAVSSYLLITSGSSLHGISAWLMGGFSSPQWKHVWVTLPVSAIGMVFICLFGRQLNIMQFDEEQAQQLGINVERTKRILLVVATIITAAAVSFGGIIGFVGIIIPHAVRLIWGPDFRFLLPLSVICGAIFLITADLLARTLLSPSEIPLGIITAFFGAPFFLYLLRRRKKAVF
ncbi:MAG: iron chelate uptake ABC transporter family permease subunit [Dehalococcoidia bacterium]|nr:iron chelate uptake ABC transporter family permease subunit [Dehalococcoidia bacterium]